MALFARIDDTGEVQLINPICVRLGNDQEKILDRLDRDTFTEADIEYTPDRVASDDYAQHVRDRRRYTGTLQRRSEASL
jgi:D-lactate dehydrogenase (quinone)